MVGADQLFARKLVDVRGQPLGQPPGIDKDDGGPVLLDQLENPRVNRGPDAPTRPLLDFPAALGEGQGGGHSRGRSTLPAAARLADSVGEGQAWSFPLESAHVFDGDFDGDLHGLDPPGVDDGDVPIRSTQEAGSLAQRPLGCRETDPLWLSLCERHQPLEAQCQVRASLCVGHRVNLVDDHPANGGQDLARRTREEQEERLRRGDQDVRGMPFDLLLTSAARQILPTVRWVIVDEIHSMADTKRGAHLALSLERLVALTKAEPQRIGLSATQRPLSETASFLGGTYRDVAIIDAGRVKAMEITVEVPVEDMSALERETPSLTFPHRVSEPSSGWQSGPAAAMAPTLTLPQSGREIEEGPRRSIWPAIHPRILELIKQHRSTIIFVNSRRLAERLAAAINELAGEDLVRAHHGSIAKEQRLLIEDALKAGRLPGLVATSSLELGIDMGAVDLVIQVESPTSVASGIQRIGRAGHSVGEPSKGTIFPKYRGDLLETAVVVDRMLRGEIETTRVPRNPLDVLAQQIVAMTAMEAW